LLGDELRGVDVEALLPDLDWAAARVLDGAGFDAAVRRGDRNPALDAGTVTRVIDRYVEAKRTRRVLDLDDLLGHALTAFRRDATFADTVRWRYRHVLVDEAQDLNPLQHRFVDVLRAGRDDLFLVGDPAQSIYGFNGADAALLLDVSTRFPGIEVVRLPTNHRSTPQVVATGLHALAVGGQPADVRSGRSDGVLTRIVGHADERAEAAAIARSIASLDPALVRLGGVAVLTRTNAQLGPIAAAMTAVGVPLRRLVHTDGSDLGDLVRNVVRLRGADDLRQWAQDALEGAAPGASDDELTAEQEVGRAVLAFLRSNPTGGGPELRAWFDTADPFGRATAGVELLTFHGAKGREWHTVHLAGCETSLVPHRSATTVAAKAEEARLLYVACTRATDALTVNWARRRNGYQRRLTPLLDGFASTAPEPMPPPDDLAVPERPAREIRLDRLRTWRASAARAGGVLPEALVTDAALASIAERPPTDADELDSLTGLGALTSRRLFAGIADALAYGAKPGVCDRAD
jgi:DNA helicase-2/ATP-dependent DNA helicase PcrA